MANPFFYVDETRGVYHDFFTILAASEKTLSLQALWKPFHLEVPREIDKAYQRVAKFLVQRQGPFRIFFLESKHGGCVLNHFMGDAALDGPMSFQVVALRLQQYTALDLLATVLQHTDQNNDFSFSFYQRICRSPEQTELFLRGTNRASWFRQAFLSLQRQERSFQRHLLDFLSVIYQMVEGETAGFRILRETLAEDLRDLLSQEGVRYFMKPWLSNPSFPKNDPFLLQNLRKERGSLVCPCIFAYYSVHMQCSEQGLVFFVGPGYAEGMAKDFLYGWGLHGMGSCLAHPHRVQALEILKRRGPMSAEDLAQVMGVKFRGLLYHLDMLALHGFLRRKSLHGKGGYALSAQGFQRLEALLRQYEGEGPLGRE